MRNASRSRGNLLNHPTRRTTRRSRRATVQRCSSINHPRVVKPSGKTFSTAYQRWTWTKFEPKRVAFNTKPRPNNMPRVDRHCSSWNRWKNDPRPKRIHNSRLLRKSYRMSGTARLATASLRKGPMSVMSRVMY